MNRIVRFLVLGLLCVTAACNYERTSMVRIVVNNRTANIIKVYVNGNLVGDMNSGPREFRVNVPVDYNNNSCISGPCGPDYATVYVSAFDTKLSKSSYTRSLYVQTDRVSSIDFTSYDFQY